MPEKVAGIRTSAARTAKLNRFASLGSPERPNRKLKRDFSSDLTTAPACSDSVGARCRTRTLHNSQAEASPISPSLRSRISRHPKTPGQPASTDPGSSLRSKGSAIRSAGMAAPRITHIALQWFDAYPRDRAQRTLVHHESVLRNGLMAYAGQRLMPDADARFADMMLSDIASSRGPSARNHARNQCGQIWRWAARQGLWAGPNPWSGAGKLPTAQRCDPLTVEQAKRVHSLCSAALESDSGIVSPVFAAYFLLILLTGLRRSEAAGLTWSSVDLRRAALHLDDHKTKRRMGRKTAPLPPLALRLLEWVRERQWSPTFVFPAMGTCVSHSGHISDPWRPWKKVREAADCGDARIHDIRHGFAQAMHDAGADDVTISKILGHKSIVTTQVYLRRPSQAKKMRAATAGVERMLG